MHNRVHAYKQREFQNMSDSTWNDVKPAWWVMKPKGLSDEGTPQWVWLLFNIVIGLCLYADIVSGRSAHANTVGRAARWSAFWVLLALVFAFLISIARGASDGMTFLVGYLVEKSLSVDNLLVILLIFKHFKIKPGRQVIELFLAFCLVVHFNDFITLALLFSRDPANR